MLLSLNYFKFSIFNFIAVTNCRHTKKSDFIYGRSLVFFTSFAATFKESEVLVIKMDLAGPGGALGVIFKNVFRSKTNSYITIFAAVERCELNYMSFQGALH